ncbi:MAG: helix-turn-helix domain-containing protein [Lactobacillus sp.]|jgi:transcriptional regulator with XRE-family HTH domain|nr:helix-turn-helix domain-containing protein [Lactobacillus sp.]
MTISANLKLVRQTNHLTQEAFALAIHVSRQTVSNWETGKTYPDIESLLIICQVFAVDLRELVGAIPAQERVNIARRDKRRLKLNATVMGITLILFLGSLCLVAKLGVGAMVLGMLSLVGLTLACVQLETLKRTHQLTNYKKIHAYLMK